MFTGTPSVRVRVPVHHTRVTITLRVKNLHAQQDLCKVVDVLSSTHLEEVIQGVIRNDEVWFFLPRARKFE